METWKHVDVSVIFQRLVNERLINVLVCLGDFQQVGGMTAHSSTSVPMLPSLTTTSIPTFGGMSGRRTSMCPPTFITGNGSGGGAGAGSSFLQQIGSGVVSIWLLFLHKTSFFMRRGRRVTWLRCHFTSQKSFGAPSCFRTLADSRIKNLNLRL